MIVFMGMLDRTLDILGLIFVVILVVKATRWVTKTIGRFTRSGT